MSLVLTLAWRNLFQDRLRFVASLMGIVVSVVLVMVQMGLYLGFSGMITTMIDHASTDLWIISTGAKYFEDLSLLNTRMRDQLIAVDGVSEVIPAVVGFSAWSLPDGAMTSVVVVGTDVAAGGLVPWNVVEGTATSLSTPGTVAIDRSYYDRLGVSGVGATSKIRALPVTVGAVTDGIRSFTTTPYVFSDVRGARSYIGLPPSFTTHFLVRVKPGADIERTRQNLLSNVAGIQALTPSQFRDQSRSFWLFRTGAGAALVAGALLGDHRRHRHRRTNTLFQHQRPSLRIRHACARWAPPTPISTRSSSVRRWLTPIIGFALAAMIGAAIAHFTAKSALQIVITPDLMIALFFSPLSCASSRRLPRFFASFVSILRLC